MPYSFNKYDSGNDISLSFCLFFFLGIYGISSEKNDQKRQMSKYGCDVIQLFYLSIQLRTKTMDELSSTLLRQKNDSYSITFSTLFPEQFEEEHLLLRIFESPTLEDHLGLLKRAHVDARFAPKITLQGDFHKKIEIMMKSYPHTLLARAKHYSHQQKVDLLIQVLTTYRQLTQQYGYFLITHDHIRVDQRNNLAVWINPDFFSYIPSLPLPFEQTSQENTVALCFLQLARNFFTTDMFKHRKLGSFSDLEAHLKFIKKRNKIHQNCKHKARQLSQSKRRSSMSMKNLSFLQTPQKRYDTSDRLSRPFSSFSTLLTSNILNRGSVQNKPISQSFLNLSKQRRDISRGSNDSKKFVSEVDTTVFSSQMKNRGNASNIKLSSIVYNTEKKSCIFGSRSPERTRLQNIKHSSMLNRNYNSFPPQFFPKQVKKQEEVEEDTQKQFQSLFASQAMQLKEQAEKAASQMKKNQVQLDLNCLLLSQINEDSEDQTGGTDLKKRQHIKDIMDEFQSLLCS